MWHVCQFAGQAQQPVIPGTSCFYGNWVEDVRAGQFIILVDFLATAWLAAAPASVAVSPMCDST